MQLSEQSPIKYVMMHIADSHSNRYYKSKYMIFQLVLNDNTGY